jgi:predicted rRNA methylase YqxC with S4 and FtsJ domains
VTVVTLDLSYLSLGEAVRQLKGRVEIAANAELVGVVKPQFELGRRTQPQTQDDLTEGVDRAVSVVEAAGWSVAARIESPVRGSRGSPSFSFTRDEEVGGSGLASPTHHRVVLHTEGDTRAVTNGHHHFA